MYHPPSGPPPGGYQPPPNHPQANPDDEFSSTPDYAPPAYPPPNFDPRPSSSHPIHPAYVPPPQWEASTGAAQVAQLYPFGVYNDAGSDNFERGVRFCEMHPNVNMAQYVTYQQHDLIRTQGIGAWTVTPPSQFDGKVTRNRDGTTEIKSHFSPTIDKTLISSFPVLWGRYNPREGAKGVYYEVEIEKLGRDAVVAIGVGCLPYPTDFRLPGWHRHSAAVHSDDGFKFFENSDGGVPFMNPIKKKDIVGVGIYHPAANSSGSIFYTLNGHRIPQEAFSGAFFPRKDFDVYAMIGVSGEVKISVNFGAQGRFKWHEGNEWGWKVGQEGFEKPRLE